jgi:hypothetical protein
MNSFRADSHVNCLKTSDVSETHSVSILGGWCDEPDHSCDLAHHSLRMETECVSETSEVFKQLIRLSAREEFTHVLLATRLYHDFEEV